MPSLTFAYDIFISYRQNDNKYDGWVTTFLSSLKKELEATVRGDVNIYFDHNPQDGFLEKHHVDESLESKLCSMIFIPIISKTYCDSESFAWKNEFLVFIKKATKDVLGMNVKLRNGNVTARVLPIRIHDLEFEDIYVLENELKGKLQSIDFIFKAKGVNHPLRPDDKRDENANQTLYRDQIKKTANAIGEIINAVRNPYHEMKASSNLDSDKETRQGKKSKAKKVLIACLALMIVIAAVFGASQYISSPKNENLEKSIAVLPFADLSPGKDQEYFSEGLSEELLNLFAKIPKLKVIARTSAFSFKGKNEDIREIGRRLSVAHILAGSVRKSGNRLLVTAQLIKTSDGTDLWSESYDREMDGLFKIQDEISSAVVDQLKIAMLGELKRFAPHNTQAYDLYLEGKYFLSQRDPANANKAIALFQKALRYDSLDARIWAGLAAANLNIAYLLDSSLTKCLKNAREYAKKAIAVDNNAFEGHHAMGDILRSFDYDINGAEKEYTLAQKLNPDFIIGESAICVMKGQVYEALTILQKASELDPENPRVWAALGNSFRNIEQFGQAHAAYKKVRDLSEKYDRLHSSIGNVYFAQGDFTRALKEFQQESNIKSQRIGLIKAYYALGEKKRSDSLLNLLIRSRESRDLSYQFAMTYASRSEKDKVFEWLGKAYEKKNPGLWLIKSEQTFKPFHADPRFIALLKKMNLPLD